MDFVVLVSKDRKLFLVYVNFGGGGGWLIKKIGVYLVMERNYE